MSYSFNIFHRVCGFWRRFAAVCGVLRFSGRRSKVGYRQNCRTCILAELLFLTQSPLTFQNRNFGDNSLHYLFVKLLTVVTTSNKLTIRSKIQGHKSPPPCDHRSLSHVYKHYLLRPCEIVLDDTTV